MRYCEKIEKRVNEHCFERGFHLMKRYNEDGNTLLRMGRIPCTIFK